MNDTLFQEGTLTPGKAFLFFLAIIPFFVGVYAYLEFNPGDYSDACYFATQNYILEYDFEETSIWLEFSRWGALLVTTTVILSLLKSIFTFFKQYFILFFKKNVVAVYGEEAQLQYLVKNMTKRKINFVFSHKGLNHKNISHHVVMFPNPQENLSFYSKYNHIFHTGKPVHLLMKNISPYMLYQVKCNIYPFNMEGLTAQKFWLEQRQTLTKLVLSHLDSSIHIVVIGEGFLAERIIDYGVQLNIFHQDQKIIYHIFGDLARYQGLHYQLAQQADKHWNEFEVYPQDTLRFYNGSWEEYPSIIKSAHTIIVGKEDDSSTLQLTSQLKTAFPLQCPLYIRLLNDGLLDPSFSQENLIFPFGHLDEVCNSEQILNNRIINYAIQLNGRYSGAKTQKEMETLWQKLSQFHQDSNLYSILFWLGRVQEKHSNDSLEQRAVLEHIRWNRFHFMYNWVYGDTKDSHARTHPCLVDFDELSFEEQEKDKATILLLQELLFKELGDQ